MRIHRLQVQAFGPFADRVDVDLDAASAAGLFLVHGPTGAGKTSLLDAVCFALYADVPGSRSRRSLRSDHAGPEVPPEVVLEATVAGRRLRITRSPEWYRPKRRGEGTTRVQPSVVLEEHRAGRWEAVSTRHDEVADVVLDLLGMGLQQFATVVLLPQGEFARFLRAEPDVRRELLQRLFDIRVFADVEAWLAEARRTGAAALDTARSALDADLLRLADALEPLVTADADTGLDAGPLEELPQRLAAVAADLTERLTSSLAALDVAEGAETAAQQALADGRALAAARARGEAARARLEALEAAAPEHDVRTARLEAAERASTLRGHLAALERLEREVTGLERSTAQARARVEDVGTDPLGDGAAALAERVAGLDDTVAAVARHADAAHDLALALADGGRRAETLGARHEQLLLDLPAAREAASGADAEVTRLSVEGARTADLVVAVGEEERRLALLDEVAADEAAAAALAPEVLAARDALSARLAELIDLRQRRLDEMAAELAAGLAEGEPCPVCGGTEHPRPARTSDPVTPEQLARTEDAVEAARAALARLETRTGALETAVRTRREVLAGADRPTVEAARAAALDELARARAAEQRLAEATAEQARARSEADRLAASLEQTATALAALDERLAEVTEEAETVRRRLAADVEAHAVCPCGGGDLAHHRSVHRLLLDLATGEDALVAARERRAEAASALDAALAEAGFPTLADASAALLTVAETDRLRDLVLAHDRDRTAARATLEDPDVVAALAVPAPDLDALHDAHAAARRAVLAGTSAHDVLERAGRALDRLRPALEQQAAHVDGLAQRHARVRDLADTVGGTGGDNTFRMRLSAFVLAARLEKVATLANERLAVMGAGRYLLEHSDDRAARGAKSGLGLKVLDQWTGRVRDTATLSGGEAFMASLALALGLADAVREEAGGLDLGTLFVDEGFGSLDDDSLEQVVSVLDGLREGGRAVGVVSHVADLRSRISHQVVVTKGVSGSGVTVRAGDAAPAA
ncbi:AAA family ATPase [Arthrobacter sp. NEB 688]|uniref:AAA family ATPase n=1 Tax=Arthrobacter sp. NEB 688 TaxID=904039 RepID=UPI001565AAB2|nr:AAA family ATPase [Arthrobacter sp. NEB 688]QKE84725.1 AAA family ATPase [Arthrobacter sp. NEB 688]